jgi:hypothetical protein
MENWFQIFFLKKCFKRKKRYFFFKKKILKDLRVEFERNSWIKREMAKKIFIFNLFISNFFIFQGKKPIKKNYLNLNVKNNVFK